MNINDIEKLNNFRIHAYGNYVMISGYSKNKEKHTFLATMSIIEHILCNMNKKIKLGPLSKCQMGAVFNTLRAIECEYDYVLINDQPMIIPTKKEKGMQRVQAKKKNHGALNG